MKWIVAIFFLAILTLGYFVSVPVLSTVSHTIVGIIVDIGSVLDDVLDITQIVPGIADLFR